jgi:hypothetical protein
MIQQTSIETYQQIRDEGLLSKMRFKIYQAIYSLEPCTASEVFSFLGAKTNQSGRFTELRELNVIKENGTKVCDITGRKAIQWTVTGNTPKGKITKLNNKPKSLKNSIKYIVKDMHKKGLMFITQEELIEMSNEN